MDNSNTPGDPFVSESARSAGSLPVTDEQAYETHLLLSSLDVALGFMESARCSPDRERAMQLLTQAVDSYGSVKGLLPKLGLRPEQVTLVSDRLKAVQQRLRDGVTLRQPMYSKNAEQGRGSPSAVRGATVAESVTR